MGNRVVIVGDPSGGVEQARSFINGAMGALEGAIFRSGVPDRVYLTVMLETSRAAVNANLSLYEMMRDNGASQETLEQASRYFSQNISASVQMWGAIRDGDFNAARDAGKRALKSAQLFWQTAINFNQDLVYHWLSTLNEEMANFLYEMMEHLFNAVTRPLREQSSKLLVGLGLGAAVFGVWLYATTH